MPYKQSGKINDWTFWRQLNIHTPQRFKRRCTGVQRVIRSGVKSLAHESASDVWLVDATFVDIDPLCSDDLTSCFLLLVTRYSIIRLHAVNSFNLGAAALAHKFRNQQRAADIVRQIFHPVPSLQSAHAIR